MTNIEGAPVTETNLAEAQKRYNEAVNALEKAGGMKFAELVNAKDPVALEYLLALEGLNEALEDSGITLEK
jgi:hypothetical protein